MKKLLLLIGILILGTMPVLAEEKTQTQKADDIKGAIVVNKQPTQEAAKQTQQCNKIYGSIIIMVQGKAPFDKAEH